MDRLAFYCLLFVGLLNPLLSLPVPDTGEKAPQHPGEATVFISLGGTQEEERDSGYKGSSVSVAMKREAEGSYCVS